MRRRGWGGSTPGRTAAGARRSGAPSRAGGEDGAMLGAGGDARGVGGVVVGEVDTLTGGGVGERRRCRGSLPGESGEGGGEEESTLIPSSLSSESTSLTGRECVLTDTVSVADVVVIVDGCRTGSNIRFRSSLASSLAEDDDGTGLGVARARSSRLPVGDTLIEHLAPTMSPTDKGPFSADDIADDTDVAPPTRSLSTAIMMTPATAGGAT